MIDFSRNVLNQGPGRAAAVLGGYDPDTDMVLILENDKDAFPHFWAPADLL